MSNVSWEWLSAVQQGRQYDLDAKTPDCAVPIVPWIHPPVHPKLQNLIVRIGRKIQLSRQDKLIFLDRSISHLALVTSGVTARNFGNPIVGTENAAAISPPGHIAFGNLNFFTERPAFGHYFALTKAEVVVCNKELLLPALKADPELFVLLVRHFECCALSDRIGFAFMAFAPVEERLKAFVISWAVHYAKLSGRDGKPWLTMTVPLTRSNRCLLANASSVSTDTYLKRWKDNSVWIRNGDFVSCPTSFLEETYKWMRKSEEQSAYSYAPTLLELFQHLHEIRSPLY